jgi:hypothetical protein
MSLKSLRQTIIQQVRCFTFLRPYFRWWWWFIIDTFIISLHVWETCVINRWFVSFTENIINI